MKKQNPGKNESDKIYDVAIIGAGITGTSVARELCRYDLNITLLERNNDVSCGSTKANSGIIHAGYDSLYNTKKGVLNARGNLLYENLCNELGIPFKRIGSLVIAKNEEDLKTLNKLKSNGDILKIPGLAILNRHDAFELEPNLSKDTIAALYAPTAGIINPWEAAIAFTENAIANGLELNLNFNVIKIKKSAGYFIVTDSKNNTIKSKIIINASGVYGDEVYNLVNPTPEYKIISKKGQYFLFDKSSYSMVSKIIFNCPTENGKGVLVAPTADGNILIGPNSTVEHNKENTKTTKEGLNYIRQQAYELIDSVDFNHVITSFAGLRAEPSNNDFIIENSSVDGFINAIGIKSPGLSSAPAIAEELVKIVTLLLPNIDLKKSFNPLRNPGIKLCDLSNNEKEKIIRENPLYGIIVCRCEIISEGEIVDAIRQPVGARSVNGIKRRVRPGAGRCQGGFCNPKVLEILSRELNVSIEEINLENEHSNILFKQQNISGVSNVKV